MSVAGVSIIPLTSCDAHLDCVAAWHHQECLRQGLSSNLQLRRSRLSLHLQGDNIPKSFIAVLNGQLIGCVSLVNYTYKSSAQPMPKVASEHPVWLSNLYVEPAYRRRGVAQQLINASTHYARRQSIPELWLSASDYTDYYAKRGWQVVRHTKLGGVRVNVMHQLLT